MVTDSSAPAQTANARLVLRIAAASQLSVPPVSPQPLVILSSALPAGTAGSNYSSSLQASDGAPPYGWAVKSGVLPAGLRLVSSTGVISGVPTASGTSSFLIEVTDSASNTTTQALSISIAAASAPSKPLQISSSALPAGMAGSAYSDSLQATGGVSPYSWSLISGVLPTGLNLSTSAGTISGIPTASGTSSFSVQVTDSAHNTATQTLGLSVAAAPVTTPVPSPGSNTLTTSDSLLNTGTPISVSYNAPGTDAKVGVVKSLSNSNQLWELVVSPWNVNAGSGTIKMSYSGAGSITTQVNLTGLDNQAVNGYPFIFYGGDQWGDQIGGQPPQFPAQLSAMSSLVADATYSLSGTFGGDIDVLYDEWLIPSKTYTGGSGGALEVEVLPYCQFADFGGFTLVKTFSQTVTVNGVQTSMNFDEYSSGKGAGNAVLFIPVNGVISGEVRLDLLAFMNEGATRPDWTPVGGSRELSLVLSSGTVAPRISPSLSPNSTSNRLWLQQATESRKAFDSASLWK